MDLKNLLREVEGRLEKMSLVSVGPFFYKVQPCSSYKMTIIGYCPNLALFFEISFSLNKNNVSSIMASACGHLSEQTCQEDKGGDIYDSMPGNNYGGYYTNWYARNRNVGNFCRTHRLDLLNRDNPKDKLDEIFHFISNFYLTYRSKLKRRFDSYYVMLAIPLLEKKSEEVKKMIRALFSQETRVIFLSEKEVVRFRPI